MNNSHPKSRIPDAPAPANVPGNLLSSVAPPSELPNFITAPAAVAEPAAPMPSFQPAPPQPAAEPVQPVPVTPVLVQRREEPQNIEHFSPAIPLSKGEPMLPIRSPEDSTTPPSPESLPDSTDVDKLGDVMPGSALFTWVKGAVSTGGLLHRVAEKAKSSVDSMITTLDPQMKEYLRSGGDIYLVVASDKEVKISPIREAFQAVFGKATVIGFPAQSDVTAVQPVGYAAAFAAAKHRIALLRSQQQHLNNNVPILAVEGFLHEALSDVWYEVSLLVLSQPSLGLELAAVSQGTAVPAPAVAALRASTPPDYPHARTGLAATLGSVMAASLQVAHNEWHEASTGVSRRDILLLAARALAGSYKRMLAVSAAET